MIWDVLTTPGRYAPLSDTDGSMGRVCPGCGETLEVGDVPSLVNGIPYDSDQANKAMAGRAHNVEAQVAHESCAYPEVKR